MSEKHPTSSTCLCQQQSKDVLEATRKAGSSIFTNELPKINELTGSFSTTGVSYGKPLEK